MCQREAQPARNYQFFCNLCHLTKIYATNFVQNKFWWIAVCGFNGIRHNFIRSFVLVIEPVDYTVRLWIWLGLNFIALKLEYKKLVFYRLYRSRTNYKRLNNLNIKKLPEQKLHGLSLKRSFICCISFINFIVVAVLINFSSSQQYNYRSRTCCYFGKYLTSKF